MKALTMDTQLKGKHILYTLLGFFGVIFAVNGYFLYSALNTLPGEERGVTYEAGLHYNATLARARRTPCTGRTNRSCCRAGASPFRSRMQAVRQSRVLSSRAAWIGRHRARRAAF